MRLDLALIGRHPGLSRRKAREAIEKGQVTVGGQAVREPGASVSARSEIAWDPNRKALPRARLRLPILFEDESVLIVDKPPGLLSVPTPGGGGDEDTALARVREYVARLRPRRPYVGRVHRLDRDTSGALVFALTPAAREALIALFRDHNLVRRYLAIVRGAPSAPGGTIDAPLSDAYEGGRRRVARPGEAKTRALTRWRLRERFPDAALLEVELETGRQHQIRVHLAHVGHPILGDRVYGRSEHGRLAPAVARPMLHAWRLELSHPDTGEPLTVSGEPPPDFEETLARLRRAAHATAKPPATVPARPGPGRAPRKHRRTDGA